MKRRRLPIEMDGRLVNLVTVYEPALTMERLVDLILTNNDVGIWYRSKTTMEWPQTKLYRTWQALRMRTYNLGWDSDIVKFTRTQEDGICWQWQGPVVDYANSEAVQERKRVRRAKEYARCRARIARRKAK